VETKTQTLEEFQSMAEKRLKAAIDSAPRPKIRIPVKLTVAKPGEKPGPKDPNAVGRFVQQEMQDWLKGITVKVREDVHRDFPGTEVNFRIIGELRNPNNRLTLEANVKAIHPDATKQDLGIIQLEDSETRFEVMVVKQGKLNEKTASYLVRNVLDAYKIYKSKGGVLEWKAFQRVIRRRDLHSNQVEEIKDIDRLQEKWILSIPLESEEDKKIIQIIRNHTKRKENENKKFISDIEGGRLVYSINYGWIDLGHAGLKDSPKTPQRIKKLLGDIRKSKPQTQIKFEMESGLTKFIWKNRGLKFNLPEVILTAQILRQVTDDLMAKGIALSIFKSASVFLEDNQEKGLSGQTRGNKSAFSEEDLPSNVLSFIKQTEGLDIATVIRAAKTFSKEESKWLASVYQFRKNIDFSPIIDFPGAEIPSELKPVKEVPQGDYWSLVSIKIKSVSIGIR